MGVKMNQESNLPKTSSDKYKMYSIWCLHSSDSLLVIINQYKHCINLEGNYFSIFLTLLHTVAHSNDTSGNS